MTKDNQVYYFDIAEGRWQGEFSFKIDRWKEFITAPISLIDRTLALILHLNGLIPGKTQMTGEILGAPEEGDAGVARVEVSVSRFGVEIFRLSGHYALAKDGTGVDIAVLERYGPPGFPARGPQRRDAIIDQHGYRAKYRITTLGAQWEGVYELDDTRTRLDAEYRSPWGSIGEHMARAVRVVPLDIGARRRWERLLDIARRLEALNRTFDGESDPRGCFAHVYSVITRNLAFALDDTGFDDPDWVIRLAEHFSDRYFNAVSDWPKGLAPRAWSMVLDALEQHRFTSIEEFVLQMFVHIVHDLPQALVKAGMTRADGRSRVEDFDRVNQLLASAIDDLQDRLGTRYSLAILILDRLFLRHDEQLAADRIAGSRRSAWYDAERLLDPERRYRVIAEIDDRVRAVVEKAVGTTIPERLILRALRTGLRALRLRPLIPPPAASLGTAAMPAPRDPSSAAMYSLFTAISLQKRRADLRALENALFTDEVRAKLGRRAVALLQLGSIDFWRDELPRLLDRAPEERYALAALIGELLEGSEL